MEPTNGTHNQQETKLLENSWYAIRTFNCQEQKVSRFLTEKQCIHFIPMKITETPKKDNEAPKRMLVPAIHNLLFIQKQECQQQIAKLLKECDIPTSIFRLPGSNKYCEIPNRDMVELRMLCDPQYSTAVYLNQDEAEDLIGKEVRVINGPFKGSIGRLVRKKKQYYLLKIITGMGVMVRISRWYCEPIH